MSVCECAYACVRAACVLACVRARASARVCICVCVELCMPQSVCMYACVAVSVESPLRAILTPHHPSLATASQFPSWKKMPRGLCKEKAKQHKHVVHNFLQLELHNTFLFAAQRPYNTLVYLRDGSASTFVCAATLE